MLSRGTPNRFLTIPPITKEVWDHVQCFHCKTLALSVLRPEKKKDGKKDENPRSYKIMMQEINNMSTSKPLHIRIGMWHTQLAEKGEAIPILDSDCKYVFMPQQKLLKAIDPTGTRLLDDVRDEIAILAKKFQAVISEDDRTYTEMTHAL
jgi:hypothetical protein